jgi:hypothetical protein
MRVHPADAETIVDVLPILGEVVIGDGVLVAELVFGLLYLTPLLHVGKLVLLRLGLAGADAADPRSPVLGVFDFRLVGGLFGGDGDIVIGRVIAETIPGCHGQSVGFGRIVGADAMGDVLVVMRVGEVVSGDRGHGGLWLLLLFEIYL